MNNTEHRAHISRLPEITADVSECFNYEYKNTIAVGLPVFLIDESDTACDNHFMWARASVWTALKYIQATDAVQQGVPIYFLIGEKNASSVMDILDKANIPSHLRVIYAQPEPIHFAVKWAGIFEEAFNDYESLLVIDVDSYPFLGNEKYRLFQKIKQQRLLDKIYTANTPYIKESRPPSWANEHMEHYLKTYNQFWDTAEAIYPDKEIKDTMLDDRKETPVIGGWFVGFPKTLRNNKDFHDMFFKLAQYSSLETTILEIYCLGTSTRLHGVEPKTLWVYEDWDQESTLSHIYTTKGFEWERQWHQDCLDTLTRAIGNKHYAEMICQL